MSSNAVVHVIGTGTIGEPLIGLLTSMKDHLGIDEVTFHKRTPLLTDRSKVKDLIRRGAKLCTDDPAVKAALMRDAMARVRNSVMTAEQKTAWDATQKRPTIRRMRTDDGKKGEKTERSSEGETPKKKEGRSRRGG